MADPASEDASQLAAFLATRDEPCPGCGYNLRGLTGASCPECRQDLQLHVGLVEPKLASFLAALIALCLGLGMSSLLLIFYVVVITLNGPQGPSGRFLLINGVGLVVFGLCVAVLLKRRNAFRRAGRGWRVAIIVSAFVLSLLYVVVFAVLGR